MVAAIPWRRCHRYSYDRSRSRHDAKKSNGENLEKRTKKHGFIRVEFVGSQSVVLISWNFFE